ncbi:polysaccharide biosynthesis protein [Ferrovum sp. PN-J185]|uniref:polysaccharide biosynthesis protein n=1 Tax=Ferrovum sp. PN-J185 TaxID=1356306 RepID=UPI001E412950|nr:nucleoside-diphosphate sugar epimerase/dehydratase [Ferrovum sp. PN-J185]MCC6068779.1 polysaccharide biosynthesis protein [Ferrovum sp. PN-J185]
MVNKESYLSLLFKNITTYSLALPRPAKRAIALLLDALLCLVSVWLAFYLRLGEWFRISEDNFFSPFYAVIVAWLIALPLFVTNGFYRMIFRYSGIDAVATITKTLVIYSVFYILVVGIVGITGVPRTVGFIQPMVLALGIGASRFIARFWLGGHYEVYLRRMSLPSVLIYGAGVAGRDLSRALSHSLEMKIIGFIDDDQRLQGHKVFGLPVWSMKEVPHIKNAFHVNTVLLAIPSITRKRRNEIIAQLKEYHLAVKTLPPINELLNGTIEVSQLRELDIDDLLGREPVAPNTLLLSKNTSDKVILVSGAGGSIGSELCRQLLIYRPKVLILLDVSEAALFQIHDELSNISNSTTLLPLIASVQDERRVAEVLSTWKPDVVYHSAAYKHVPLVEDNPVEGIKNNVFGTSTMARLSLQYGVSHFILISTDKAVRPTNVMGASKRIAEMILQALAQKNNTTIFTMVRFGNVLGSSGSVVPKFREQIKAGGPITLTHPDIERYFMSIPEAAQLVIQAGALAQGGEVFVLDMGESVKIIDLAKRMIELSGLTVKDNANQEGDIEIEITGLRPGEKLFEELLIEGSPISTLHPKILKINEHFLPLEQLEHKLNDLQHSVDQQIPQLVKDTLQEIVVEFNPHQTITIH